MGNTEEKLGEYSDGFFCQNCCVDFGGKVFHPLQISLYYVGNCMLSCTHSMLFAIHHTLELHVQGFLLRW